MYIYIYIHIYMYTYIYIYVSRYIYITQGPLQDKQSCHAYETSHVTHMKRVMSHTQGPLQDKQVAKQRLKDASDDAKVNAK